MIFKFVFFFIVLPIFIGKTSRLVKEYQKYKKYTQQNKHQPMKWKLFNSVYYIIDRDKHMWYNNENYTCYYRNYKYKPYRDYEDIYILFNFVDWLRLRRLINNEEYAKKHGKSTTHPNATNDLLAIIQEKITEELERSQKMIEEGAEGIKLVLERMESEGK